MYCQRASARWQYDRTGIFLGFVLEKLAAHQQRESPNHTISFPGLSLPVDGMAALSRC